MKTRWIVRGSEGLDALSFLSPLSGDPFYVDYYQKEVAEFARYLKATPPSEGSGGVFYPGEVEYIREQQRKAAGIEIEDATWEKLRALASDYKLAAQLDLA